MKHHAPGRPHRQFRRPRRGSPARRFYPIPADVADSGAFKQGFLAASLAWAAVGVVRATLRLWLVSHLSVGTYVLVDSVVAWPIYLALIWFTGWDPLRLLRSDGQLLP